jgi:LmbE family N-acetylglucosaminyl deacetylase
MAFPHLVTAEGLQPHAVTRLYLFWSERPTAFVDITATLDVKLAALHAHVTQHRHPAELDDRIRRWAARTGEAMGLAAAEAFTVIDLG